MVIQVREMESMSGYVPAKLDVHRDVDIFFF
jgi:hypothetical protein